MKVIFHDRIEQELDAAASWLDGKGNGLGREFLIAFQTLLSSIRSNPFQFSPASGSRHEDEIRFSQIVRFGYLIYFKIYPEQSIVKILAVQHGSRNPVRWWDRLDTFDLQAEE